MKYILYKFNAMVFATLIALILSFVPVSTAQATNFLQCVSLVSSKVKQSSEVTWSGQVLYLEFRIILRDSCNLPSRVSWYFDEYTMQLSLRGETVLLQAPQPILKLTPSGTEYVFRMNMINPGVKYPQLNLNANGFFGSYETSIIEIPSFELKTNPSNQEVESKKKVNTRKIVCIKGNEKWTISGKKPKCPSGWKQKK